MTPAQIALGFAYDRSDTAEEERFGLPDDALGWSVTGRAARPAPVPVPLSPAAARVAARRRLDSTSVWVEPQTQVLPRVERVAAPTIVMPGVLLPALDLPPVAYVPRHRVAPGRRRWWRSEQSTVRSHRRTRGGAR